MKRGFFCIGTGVIVAIMLTSCGKAELLKEQVTEKVFGIDMSELGTEVKAEENVKSKSLHSFINEHQSQMKGLRISMKQYVNQEWMENIPLVATEAYFKLLANGEQND